MGVFMYSMSASYICRITVTSTGSTQTKWHDAKHFGYFVQT